MQSSNDNHRQRGQTANGKRQTANGKRQTANGIAHGLVLADPAQPATHANISIEDGVIREIGAPCRFDAAAAQGARRIDANDWLVIPGLVNAHSHGHGALGRGAVDDVALEGFLAASPSISGHRGLADLALSTTLNAVVLLKKGCKGDRPLFDAYSTLLASLPSELKGQVARLRGAPLQAMQAMQALLATVRAAAPDWPFNGCRVRLELAPTIPLHSRDDFKRGALRLQPHGASGAHRHAVATPVGGARDLGLRRGQRAADRYRRDRRAEPEQHAQRRVHCDIRPAPRGAAPKPRSAPVAAASARCRPDPPAAHGAARRAG